MPTGAFEPSWIELILLFTAGLLAGFVDAVAGGGGLISLPALLAGGMPPQLALGTNKLQGSFGALTAAATYVRNGTVSLRSLTMGIACTFIGAMFGALTVHRIDPVFLQHFIPAMLLVVLVYTLLSPQLGEKQQSAVISSRLFYLLCGLGLGFYDGFFGPGTGSFWTAAFLVLLGRSMTQAVGCTKVVNFTSNIVALAVFALSGGIHYGVGLIMALGQVIGARIGARLAISKGTRFIRPLFLAVVFLTLARMLYQNYL